MRNFAFILTTLISLTVSAQSSFTAHLRKQQPGKGTIIITQSQEIELLVNGKTAQTNLTKTTGQPSDKAKQQAKSTLTTETSKNATDTNHNHTSSVGNAEKQETHNLGTRHHIDRMRHKAQGFRICIYTGGNSRKDKAQAIDMAEKCHKRFGELATYPTFVAPRWVTYVGDFRTRQDAQKYVNLIRKSRITYEVRIVKSEVNLPD